MNQNSTIDSIFKNQLQQMEQPGADENWQRLEKELLAQQKKKRRGGAWLLGLLLLLGSGAALIWGLNGNEKQHGATVADVSQAKPATGTTTTILPDGANTTATNGTASSPDATNTAPPSVIANTGTDNGHNGSIHRKGRQSITLSGGDMSTGTATTGERPIVFNKKGNQKIKIGAATTATSVDAETMDKTTADNNITVAPLPAYPASALTDELKKDPQETELTASHIEPPTAIQNDQEPMPATRKDKKERKPPPQLELAVGVDVSNGAFGSGKYGIAMVRLSLNKKANLLLGAGYASNTVSEGYKQADKPNLLNREIDAKLRGLNMLQFPILYEQAIKENKLLFRAGITPVYILDAAIVNIPNSFGGNPTSFRTFTLNDINRLNVLFTAGLQMRLTQRLGLELKAHYGLTELVKNSYINQSGENNNFKSTQVGLLFMLGKKR
jgi:hypothetical protein